MNGRFALLLRKSLQRLVPSRSHQVSVEQISSRRASLVNRRVLVAIAYVMQKAPYVFPIIGGRKVEHLKQNLQGLDVALTQDHINYLESILPFDLGFPTGRFVSTISTILWMAYVQLISTIMNRETVPPTISCTRMLALLINGPRRKPFALQSSRT